MPTEKVVTVKELARLGGLARARKYSKRQIRRWGKLGGRPRKLRGTRINSRVRKVGGSSSGLGGAPG